MCVFGAYITLVWKLWVPTYVHYSTVVIHSCVEYYVHYIIDLIEVKTTGIMDLLNEEYKLPKGSAEHFTDAIHCTHKNH